MSIFDFLDIATLQGESSRHNSEVLAKNLQPYNDILFDRIVDELQRKKTELFESMRTKINKTDGNIRQVSIPIWTYNTRFFKKSKDDYTDELRTMNLRDVHERRSDNEEHTRMCRDNGWHWTLGVRSETDWTLPLVPVDLVVRKTDILNRLALAFHSNMTVIRQEGKLIHEDDVCNVREVVLCAVFHPDGIHSPRTKRALNDAVIKYPYNYATYLVWWPDQVVFKGPNLEPPRTPPGTPPGSPICPGAPARCYWEQGYWD